MTTDGKQSAPATSDAELKTALDAFEKALLTPIIAGDLGVWFEHLQLTANEAADKLNRELTQFHTEEYDEIGNQDPELLSQIDRLKEEDCAILEAFEKFRQTLTRAAEQSPKLEPDEDKATRLTRALINEGVMLLARIRKQELTLQTWYAEAFTRDRGPVD
ncbi:MAG: hypothetical protein U0805_02255 [Pirellulales bacterium]